MKLSFKNLLTSSQISKEDIQHIFSQTDHFYTNSKVNSQFNGKILASLFFEPSTRTRFSFESAAYRIGGNVLSLEQGISSSAKKGESLSDMGRMMNHYADIAAIRHPQPGSIKAFAEYTNIPVINAGDGANEHPTQSLLDLYTIYKEKGGCEQLTVGFIGDLKYSRTVRSLLTLLNYYNNKLVFISDPRLTLDPQLKKELKETGNTVVETTNLEEIKNELDILYVTRVQEERFPNHEAYMAVKDKYILTADMVREHEKLTILHPLPRIHEIDPSVDQLTNAKYFKQAEYGLYVRMALLELMI